MNSHKGKAVELVKRFIPYVKGSNIEDWYLENAKACACIVCDEVMKATFIYDSQDHEFAEKVREAIQEITVNDIQ